jgi:hypothetical protein
MHFSRFNGKSHRECLNASEFVSIEDATSTLEAWRTDRNLCRRRHSLGHLTPGKYLQRCRKLEPIEWAISSLAMAAPGFRPQPRRLMPQRLERQWP